MEQLPREPDTSIVISAQPVQQRPPRDDDQETLFDWALIANYVRFVLRAVRRHKLLFLAVLSGIVGAAIAALIVLPRTYHVETTLQAQRNQVISSLSNPNRSMPLDADAPTRQAAETVLRHDNLLALLHQTDFLKRWPLKRAPILLLKDRVMALVQKPQTDDEKLDNFVFYLASRISVSTGDSTVTIAAELPDPQLAYDMVDVAVQNFLEARHAADVASIADAITILESRASQSYEALSASLEQLRTLREARRARLGSVVRHSAPPPAPKPRDPEAAQLMVQIESKRRALSDLEEFRRRRVSELQGRLQEMKAVYADAHPMMQGLEQSLEALKHDSPQLSTLRRELAALEEDAKKRGISATDETAHPAQVVVRDAQLEPEDPREGEDQQIEYAKADVRRQLEKYNGFLDRIEAARLELDTARAAFKYRYSIIAPARRPRGPIKPNVPKILVAALAAGTFLGTLAAALRDLRTRKLLERWQVEQALAIPVLAELPPK